MLIQEIIKAATLDPQQKQVFIKQLLEKNVHQANKDLDQALQNCVRILEKIPQLLAAINSFNEDRNSQALSQVITNFTDKQEDCSNLLNAIELSSLKLQKPLKRKPILIQKKNTEPLALTNTPEPALPIIKVIDEKNVMAVQMLEAILANNSEQSLN